MKHYSCTVHLAHSVALSKNTTVKLYRYGPTKCGRVGVLSYHHKLCFGMIAMSCSSILI